MSEPCAVIIVPILNSMEMRQVPTLVTDIAAGTSEPRTQAVYVMSIFVFNS
jgi:hypothetical protein